MKHKLEDILFIDIETVSQADKYENASESMQTLWKKKHDKSDYLNSITCEQSYNEKAAIFAEFGKIICISIALYDKLNDEYRIKSFANVDEKILLKEFDQFCRELKKSYVFCGHNIKEFDIPYLCRRFLINILPIPNILDHQDKKPWEVEILDTMQLWKFGDFKNYTSLEILTTIFNIPSPKDDIDGSQVGQVYWEEKNLNRIVNYCQNDVIALIQLYSCLCQQPLINKDKIKIVNL